MNSDWHKDYPQKVDLLEQDLNDNNSLKKMFGLIGENQRVIDFGCATGYFASLLATKGCEVIGLEVNPKAAKVAEQYCKQVIVTDLDFVSLKDVLPKESFDVAVFGDVLEHLRNPWQLLQEVREFLTPDGYVVASIPNIAHGAIRLSLLQGNFEYAELGILDNTHLRFFTRKTVQDLFESSGYILDVLERTKLPIFTGGLVPIVQREDFSPELVQKIELEEDAETLQFVLKAFPQSLKGKAKISKVELEQTQQKLHDTCSELEQTQQKLHHTHTELEQTQQKLHHSHTELEQTQEQLHHTHTELEQTQQKLNHTHTELEQVQQKLHHTHTELEHFQFQVLQLSDKLVLMESSKFWKLRKQWFTFRRILGLKAEE